MSCDMGHADSCPAACAHAKHPSCGEEESQSELPLLLTAHALRQGLLNPKSPAIACLNTHAHALDAPVKAPQVRRPSHAEHARPRRTGRPP